MLKKKFITGFLLLFVACLVQAQQYNRTDAGATITIKGVSIEVQFFTPSLVRILKYPAGLAPHAISLSVIRSPQKVNFKIVKVGDNISIKTDSLQVNINHQSGQIGFYSTRGVRLLAERESGLHFIPAKDGAEDTYKVTQQYQLDQDEAIYGLGQHQKGSMNQRNQKIILKQGNMEIAIPFFQSLRGYGLFWDNYSTTTFRDSANVASFESEVGVCADYYFIMGSNADQVIGGYRWLTGRAPMFPRWVFGYWQSRERYKSQYETVDVVRQYRNRKVPLDGIVQDWQYWGEDESQWNSTEFGNPRFPEPQKMIDSVHDLKAKIIISVWPSFGNKTKIFSELKEGNMLFDLVTWPINPNVQVYDPFHPKARDIYWKYINKNIFSLGMDGWWLDATEPDQLRPKPADDDNKTYLGSFRKVRNAFPLVTTGGVYEHQRGVENDKRVFILTRSGFAGQQRYGTMIWSGDIQSRWDVLRAQVSAGCNLSLSGIPYWNSDIGGFFPRGKYPKGVKDPAYQELYVRWLQFGTFTPMMRSHGEFTPREIYQFGEKGSWAYDAIEKFINLRYRLLPYNYSNAWEISSNSGTMMRALIMDFAADRKVWDINNEFLFGKSLLVCPVTDSMYTSRAGEDAKVDFSTTKKQKLYLPSGTSWFDFWTGEKISGGKEIEKETPIDIIPLYVKAGAILPMGPFQQYIGEKDDAHLEIRVYEGDDGTFTLYEDENDNYNYEKGLYSTISFKWNNREKKLTIGNRKGNYHGMLKTRKFNIVLVTKNKGTGMEVPVKYDKVVTYTGKAFVVKF